MGKNLIRYIGLFIALILLQLLFFNNFQLSGYINPYIYVLFILVLPYGISGWALLLLGFGLGLTLDAFMNTYGMHSSATLLMAFLRPYVLKYIGDNDNIDQTRNPSLNQNGPVWFIKYSLVLVFSHHLVLFLIETFTLGYFLQTLWRTMASTVVTVLFIMIGLYITKKK